MRFIHAFLGIAPLYMILGPESLIFFKNLQFVTWCDGMVKNVMVWLFPKSTTLPNFVNGHNRFGDEVYPCFFGNYTIVHDLRPGILDFLSKICSL